MLGLGAHAELARGLRAMGRPATRQHPGKLVAREYANASATALSTVSWWRANLRTPIFVAAQKGVDQDEGKNCFEPPRDLTRVKNVVAVWRRVEYARSRSSVGAESTCCGPPWSCTQHSKTLRTSSEELLPRRADVLSKIGFPAAGQNEEVHLG
jgi:hypothetical protein